MSSLSLSLEPSPGTISLSIEFLSSLYIELSLLGSLLLGTCVRKRSRPPRWLAAAMTGRRDGWPKVGERCVWLLHADALAAFELEQLHCGTVRAAQGRLSALSAFHKKSVCMALLYGRAGRLTARGFRGPGQSCKPPPPLLSAHSSLCARAPLGLGRRKQGRWGGVRRQQKKRPSLGRAPRQRAKRRR